MSETIVSCTGATHPVTGRVVHVLGYQNKAKSDGPNCMILPFPAAAVMGRDNTLDTRSMPSVRVDGVGRNGDWCLNLQTGRLECRF